MTTRWWLLSRGDLSAPGALPELVGRQRLDDAGRPVAEEVYGPDGRWRRTELFRRAFAKGWEHDVVEVDEATALAHVARLRPGPGARLRNDVRLLRGWLRARRRGLR